MIYVEVHELGGPNMDDVIAGTIAWDGHQLIVSDPNDFGLQQIMGSTIMNFQTHQSVTARSDPQGWLRNLHHHYRSHGVWVTPLKTGQAHYNRGTRPTMYSHQAFLQAMRREPDDDTVRLVYADYLDENGFPNQAARLRWWVGARRAIQDGIQTGGPQPRNFSTAYIPQNWVHGLFHNEVSKHAMAPHPVLGDDNLNQLLDDARWVAEKHFLGLDSEGEHADVLRRVADTHAMLAHGAPDVYDVPNELISNAVRNVRHSLQGRGWDYTPGRVLTETEDDDANLPMTAAVWHATESIDPNTWRTDQDHHRLGREAANKFSAGLNALNAHMQSNPPPEDLQ